MKQIALTAFYAAAPNLREPVEITKGGEVIGSYYPAGDWTFTSIVNAIAPGSGPIGRGVGQFNSRPFTPAPKTQKIKKERR